LIHFYKRSFENMPILQHSFCFLGQLRQSVFPDLFLTTKDAGPTDLIPAHRVVLSAVSTKLHNMCREGGKVLVRNIQYRVLEEVVRFIYTGSVETESDEDIENLRDGLDMLTIKISTKKVNCDTNANEVSDEGVNTHLQVEHAQESCITVSDVRYGIDVTNFSYFDELKTNCLFKEDEQASSRTEKQAEMNNVKSFQEVLESITINDSTNETEGLKDIRIEPRDNKEEEGSFKAEEPSSSVGKKVTEAGDYDENVHGIKKIDKRLTKVPCDYCDQYVTLCNYVSHCKKIHSIGGSEDDGRCKCPKCGARVHIIAKKFHDSIYHPAVAGKKHDQSKPVELVEHNRNTPKIVCEFCNGTIVFQRYRSHVKSKHPEVNQREVVKCGKCYQKVFKIAFKYHREIYHKSAQVTSRPVPVDAPVNPRSYRKRKFPKVALKDKIFEAEVDSKLQVPNPSLHPSDAEECLENKGNITDNSKDDLV